MNAAVSTSVPPTRSPARHSPDARRPARLSSERRRDQITAAALKVLAERGGRHFTAQALADEVGVTDGALFRHFASLEQVVGAAIDRVEEILFAGFPPTDTDPMDQLGRFFSHRVAAVQGNPHVARLLFSDELEQVAGERGAARLAEFKRRSIGFVRRCLDRAQRQHRLADGVDPEAATVIIVGALMALAQRRGGGARSSGGSGLEHKVWQVVERLIRRSAPASGGRP